MQVTACISDGNETIESKAVVGVDLDQKGMQPCCIAHMADAVSIGVGATGVAGRRT